MPVPTPVTGFVAVPDSQQGLVTCTIVPPAGILTGLKIEGYRPSLDAWVTQYDDVMVTTRNLYPTTLQAWDFRVSVKNASGYSDPVTANNVILPGHGAFSLPVWLVSLTDTTCKVPLGVYDNEDNAINWVGTRDEKTEHPMGQRDLDFIYSMQETYIADQMDWILRPFTREDGTRQRPMQLVNKLFRMWREKHTIQYRDHLDQIYYCKISQPRPRTKNSTGMRVSFTLTSVRGPVFPLTS